MIHGGGIGDPTESYPSIQWTKNFVFITFPDYQCNAGLFYDFHFGKIEVACTMKVYLRETTAGGPSLIFMANATHTMHTLWIISRHNIFKINADSRAGIFM